MSETDQGPVLLEGRDLMAAVRRILAENPERHDQQMWLGNAYLTPDEIEDASASQLLVPVDLVRPYAMRPLTAQPEEQGAPWPVCGSTGCVAGWAAVLSAPPGSFIRSTWIVLPDGDEQLLNRWAEQKMGITSDQASYLFSPNRGRERLIRLLDALIENPETDLFRVA